MIKINNSNIVSVSKGDIRISKIYKGEDLVWDKNSIIWQRKD